MPAARSKSQRQLEIETRLLGLSEVVSAQVDWDTEHQDLFVRLRKLPENNLLAILGRLTNDLSNRKATKRIIVQLLDKILEVMLCRLADEKAILDVVTKRLPRNRPSVLRTAILAQWSKYPNPKYTTRVRFRMLFQESPGLFTDWFDEEKLPKGTGSLPPDAEKKLLPRYKENERLPRPKKKRKRGS